MLTLTIAAYFAAAALLWVAGDRVHRWSAAIAATPFVAHLGVVTWLAASGADDRMETVEWIPSLGIAITSRIDALSLLLSAMVAGIGLLIVVYSARYVSAVGRRVAFLALLALFTGGMAGVVVTDNLFALFLYWEITTVASYLLIGFEDEEAAPRAAALQAILVTTAGGLAMLGGFVLLNIAGGTTSISELASSPPSGSMTTVALLLVALGAFTKSAQAPFHFWLPGAMSAPTPASAYLHSATMVKAGIVLLVLVEPIFTMSNLWTPIVTGVGLITMLLGATVAMRQHDLKLLLAHGTISQLGLMTALIGLGLTAAAVSVMLAHAAFKAGLFLVVGAIDKATGTRDIRRLGGLRRPMPWLATAAALAALSMAGIPPLAGFVTKEAAFDLLIVEEAWVALGVIALASVLTVAYSARFWVGAFAGDRPDDLEVRTPPPAIAFPPILLGFVSLAIGVAPGPLGDAVSTAIAPVKLVLWPGLKPALGVSAVVVLLGVIVHVLTIGRSSMPTAAVLPSASRAYTGSIRLLNRVADIVTGVLQNGSLPVYLAVIVTTVVAVPVSMWLTDWPGTPSLPLAHAPVEVVLGLAIAIAAIAATRVDRRLAAALLLGVVGYGVAGIYVAYRAPDLALTQLLAETLTIALFAFVLAKLPRRFGADPQSLSRRVRVLVAGVVGSAITIGAMLTTSVDSDRAIAAEYVDRSVDAGGRNVVNIILTNFRALDTLGEITVLAIAAAGVSALVLAARDRDEETTS